MCADSLPTDGEKVSSTHVPVARSLKSGVPRRSLPVIVDHI